MKLLLNEAKDNLIKAQDSQYQYANISRNFKEFKIGDKVLIATSILSPSSELNRNSKKLSPRYSGPYKILEIISSVAYKIELPPHMKAHPVIHVSALRPFKATDLEFPNRTETPEPPIITANREFEFEVETILDKRINKKGQKEKVEYLIKWKGYPEHDSTWEPLVNLKNALELIQEFEDQKSKERECF